MDVDPSILRAKQETIARFWAVWIVLSLLIVGLTISLLLVVLDAHHPLHPG